MILVNHYAIWPPIPTTIFIKHCWVEIIACPFVLFHNDQNTNKSPYIEKWGVQSRPPHCNLCLFECYPQKDVNVLMLPTVGCFCFRVNYRRALLLSFTHRKLLLFQGHTQKILQVIVLPTERCFCFNIPHRKVFCF